MHVKIGSQEIEVEVSDGGMFYDKETKLYSAKTLKGLEKKLREARTQKGGYPIEHSDGRLGHIIGRHKNGNYKVKWDATGVEEFIYSYYLRKRTTPEDKQKLHELELVSTAAYSEYQKAISAVSAQKNNSGLGNDVSALYPRS